jgi:hypothetical protein
MDAARDSALALAKEKGLITERGLYTRCGDIPTYPRMTIGRRAIADFDRDPPVIALGPMESVVDTLRFGVFRNPYEQLPGTIELSWQVVYYERVEEGLTRGRVQLDSLFLSIPVP